MDDLIRRSALLKSIGEVSTSPLNEWDTMGVLKIVNEQPSVTDTNVGNKWIPCSERLPDIKEGKYASDCVLVTLKWWDGEISETVGWYNRTGTWSEGGTMSKVIAWMPYEPYKGE